jgi:hypothetical protein
MRGGLLRAYQDSHRKGESNQATAERLYQQIHAPPDHHQPRPCRGHHRGPGGHRGSDRRVTLCGRGLAPDLGRVVVIESSTEAVLVSEVPLPDL